MWSCRSPSMICRSMCPPGLLSFPNRTGWLELLAYRLSVPLEAAQEVVERLLQGEGVVVS